MNQYRVKVAALTRVVTEVSIKANSKREAEHLAALVASRGPVEWTVDSEATAISAVGVELLLPGALPKDEGKKENPNGT